MQQIYYPTAKPYPITSPYGPRGSGFHAGIDYGAPTGTEVLASVNGIVKNLKDGYGALYCYITTAEGWGILTVHHKDFVGASGRQVKAGDVIAHSDNTGNSTGPHIHFEVRKVASQPGSHVNPNSLGLKYFNSVQDEMTQVNQKTKTHTNAGITLYKTPATNEASNAVIGKDGKPVSIPQGHQFPLVEAYTYENGKDYNGNKTWVYVAYGEYFGWIPTAFVTYDYDWMTPPPTDPTLASDMQQIKVIANKH